MWQNGKQIITRNSSKKYLYGKMENKRSNTTTAELKYTPEVYCKKTIINAQPPCSYRYHAYQFFTKIIG